MDGRILVVDDEKEIADLVEFYLLGEGFAVEKCYDAKTALAVTTSNISLYFKS